jgi:hypothetical protein
MNKDLRLAMDAVSSSGAIVPLGTHAAEICAKLNADHADQDFSAVINFYADPLIHATLPTATRTSQQVGSSTGAAVRGDAPSHG